MSELLKSFFGLFTSPPKEATQTALKRADNASAYLDHQKQEASRLTRELRQLEASLTTAGKGPAK